MEIVINISDELYNKLVEEKDLPNRLKIEAAITNGTPLPKGHGDLKDADELKEVFNTTEDANYCQWSLNGIVSDIDDAPTIIKADTESRNK